MAPTTKKAAPAKKPSAHPTFLSMIQVSRTTHHDVGILLFISHLKRITRVTYRSKIGRASATLDVA
jgi:hypothetical protein